MGQVVALVDDLFFQAKILETARQTGVEVKIVATGPALLEAVAGGAGHAPGLLLVDLNLRGGAIQVLEALHQAGNPAPVIAFLSHVQVELAERARAAGCSQVMPRSKFSQDLAEILRRARPQ